MHLTERKRQRAIRLTAVIGRATAANFPDAKFLFNSRKRLTLSSGAKKRHRFLLPLADFLLS